MGDRYGDGPPGHFIFELNVRTLSLTVDRQMNIDLVWIAGSQRSQTGESISLVPTKTVHQVNQKLIIHHKFSDKKPFDFKSTIQVLESHSYVAPTILAACELDLGSLIFEKASSTLTAPLTTKLDENATLSFSVKTTNMVLRDQSITSGSISLSDRSSLYRRSSLLSSIVSTDKTGTMNDLKTEEIYLKINKMATKLSHIEKEIQAKTMKLNSMNHKSMDQFNKVRIKLENQIAQKDKQIKILAIQLDEMHAALALSHQRELELGGYGIDAAKLAKRITVSDDLSVSDTISGMGSDYYGKVYRLKSSGGSSYFQETSVSDHLGDRVGQCVPGRNYESYQEKNVPSSVINDLAPRNVEHRRLYPTTGQFHSVEGSENSLNMRMPMVNRSVGDGLNGHWHSRKGTRDNANAPTRTYSSRHEMPGKEGSEGCLSEEMHSIHSKLCRLEKKLQCATRRDGSSKLSPGDNMGMYPKRPIQPTSPAFASRIRIHSGSVVQEGGIGRNQGKFYPVDQLKTPRTAGLFVGKTPQLIHREQKPRLTLGMPHGPQQLTSKNAAANSLKTSPPVGAPLRLGVNIDEEKDIENRIISLERDLITTKVALADSETQRDIEIARLLKNNTTE